LKNYIEDTNLGEVIKIPFKSAAQEYYLQINFPEIYRKWVREYGHHPDYYDYLRKKKRRKKKRRVVSKKRKPTKRRRKR